MKRQTVFPRYFLTPFMLLFSVFALVLSGCLTTQAVEMRISLNLEGDAGSALVTFYDIESDHGTSEGRADDFAGVIGDWSYRTNPSDRGHAMERKLWVEDGELNGSYREYFADIRDLLDGEETIIDETGIRYFLDPDTQMETNGMVSDWTGRLEETESGWVERPIEDGEDPDQRLVITWPAGTRELWVKMVEAENDADAPEPSLSFVEMYEMYMKGRSPFDEQVRSVFSHLTYSSLHDFLGQPEEAEKARRAVCVALDEVLALPDPNPEVLQEAAGQVSAAGLCPEQCRSAERLAKEVLYKDSSEQ